MVLKAMGSKERRDRERDETRQKILDAARELFATYGYEGVSMRKIAEKIEYSATTIYQHFADKETLIKELCYSDFRHLAATLKDLLKLKDPIDGIRKCGMAYVQFAVAYPNHYRLMFMTPFPAMTKNEGEECEAKGNPDTDSYALLRQLVENAAVCGVLRKSNKDLELVVQTLWAGVHGVAALEIVMKGDTWLPWRPLKQRTLAMLDAMNYGIFAEKKPCRR
jgi:AcrR family transcriptional regulator